MILHTSCLREIDVINVCDGKRLGWVCDFEIDGACGKICAVFVSEKLFGFSGNKNTLRLPWDKIKCIGEDAILVDCVRDAVQCREEGCGQGKRGLFR